jgi:hypothetical protein
MITRKVFFIGMAGFFLLYLSLFFKELPSEFQFQRGDLLFQDLDCGPPCDAIEAVTVGYQNANLSHCAIISSVGPNLQDIIVIESIGSEVEEILLKEFLERSPKVLVGRLKKEHQSLIGPALNFIETLLGKPYDFIYSLENDSYYCSEIIYEGLKYADASNSIFSVQPMTFKQPSSQEFFPIWVDYYQGLNHPIPEGELGLNPGSMSRSNQIDIIYMYQQPSGMK